MAVEIGYKPVQVIVGEKLADMFPGSDVRLLDFDGEAGAGRAEVGGYQYVVGFKPDGGITDITRIGDHHDC